MDKVTHDNESLGRRQPSIPEVSDPDRDVSKPDNDEVIQVKSLLHMYVPMRTYCRCRLQCGFHKDSSLDSSETRISKGGPAEGNYLRGLRWV